MDELLKLDEQFFLWLNGFHTPWLDPAMAFLTQTQVWIPLFIFLIYLILKTYKKDSWIVLVGLIVLIALTDQLTGSVMKPYFERLRPSHEPSLVNVIHLVNENKGGRYGFASSHAANTVGVALFVWLALRKKYRFSWLVFGWALIMSYSRIYLGLHYPGDIFVGVLIGLLFGWILFSITNKVLQGRKQKLSTQ